MLGRRFGTARHHWRMSTVLRREYCDRLSGTKRHEGGPVWTERKTHEDGQRWNAEADDRSHRHQTDADILRTSKLGSGLSDCLDDDEMEISPISAMYPSLMSGSKTDHDARKCPRSTKFVVEV